MQRRGLIHFRGGVVELQETFGDPESFWDSRGRFGLCRRLVSRILFWMIIPLGNALLRRSINHPGWNDNFLKSLLALF